MNKVYGYDSNIYETSIGNIKHINDKINCVYSSNGITTMSTKQYNNYIEIINNLKKENQQLKKQKDDVVKVLYQLKRSARWERHLYEVDYMLGMLDETNDN